MSDTLHLEAKAEGLHADARRLRDLEARALEIEAEASTLQTRVHDLQCLAERVRRLAELDARGPDALLRRAADLDGEAHKLEAVAAIRRDCETRQARAAARTAEPEPRPEAGERFYLCQNVGENRFRILVAGRGGFSTEDDALDVADQPYELYPGHVILPGVLASLRVLTEGIEVAPSDDPEVRLIQKSRTHHDDE